MSDTSDLDSFTVNCVLRWISVVRNTLDNPAWLPSEHDAFKSGLLNRIASGKEPLAEPPPCQFSYPWYEVVEKPGPHYVDCRNMFLLPLNSEVHINQNLFRIEETDVANDSYIISDSYHKTSYRFRLWSDPDVKPDGCWLIQNVKFFCDKKSAAVENVWQNRDQVDG